MCDKPVFEVFVFRMAGELATSASVDALLQDLADAFVATAQFLEDGRSAQTLYERSSDGLEHAAITLVPRNAGVVACDALLVASRNAACNDPSFTYGTPFVAAVLAVFPAAVPATPPPYAPSVLNVCAPTPTTACSATATVSAFTAPWTEREFAVLGFCCNFAAAWDRARGAIVVSGGSSVDGTVLLIAYYVGTSAAPPPPPCCDRRTAHVVVSVVTPNTSAAEATCAAAETVARLLASGAAPQPASATRGCCFRCP